MSRRRILALLTGLVLLLLPAAPAVAKKSTLTFFRTPSGNIGCLYATGGGDPTMLRCDLLEVDHVPARPASCTLDYGHAFGLNRTGRARRLCVGDTAVDPKAKTLAYGKTRHLGVFTCTSRKSGLRCTARSGHGFVLSRATQRLF
jgi:hypothetical protein